MNVTSEPDHPISYLRVPDEQEWPPEVRELADLFSTTMGFVPNILRAFVLFPDLLGLVGVFR